MCKRCVCVRERALVRASQPEGDARAWASDYYANGVFMERNSRTLTWATTRSRRSCDGSPTAWRGMFSSLSLATLWRSGHTMQERCRCCRVWATFGRSQIRMGPPRPRKCLCCHARSCRRRRSPDPGTSPRLRSCCRIWRSPSRPFRRLVYSQSRWSPYTSTYLRALRGTTILMQDLRVKKRLLIPEISCLPEVQVEILVRQFYGHEQQQLLDELHGEEATAMRRQALPGEEQAHPCSSER